MRRLTYTNGRGESLTFYLSPMVLESLTGVGEVDTEVQSQTVPYQDGETYIDSKLNPRIIEMEITLTERDMKKRKTMREEIIKVCNPKAGLGIVNLEMDGDVKEIDAIPDGVPAFPQKESAKHPWRKSLITFRCPDPRWRSLSIEEEPTFEPLFEFPFEGTFEMGVQRDRRIIDNDGDTEAPIQVEFYGPATNPIITNNTTEEFVKVNQELGESEVMKIDTTPGKKSVVFVSEDGTERNVFNWIDLESSFFQLVLGENDIQYSADSDIQGAVVNIYYSKLYVGM